MKKCPYCAEEIQDEATVCRYCNRDLVTSAPIPKIKKGLKFSILAFILLAIVLVVGGVTSWYYFFGPCGKIPANRSINRLKDLHIRWMDATKLANSTSRVALSGPISTLQSIRQETQDLKVSSCMQTARESLIESMDHIIDGFLAFAAQKGDSIVSSYFDLVLAALDIYSALLVKVKQCIPLCSFK